VHVDPAEYLVVQGAWVHRSARLPEDPKAVVLEPGALIGADVEIGPGTWVGAGAVIYGPTRLGEKNEIWPHVVLGGAPQDIHFGGEPTRLEIGSRNVFREGVTIHRATTKAERVTRIGDDCYFMAYAHVGHDSDVGDRVIFANNVLIAGHCTIESFANIAGGVAVAQFVTVGKYAFICGTCGVRRDMEPYVAHDKDLNGEAAPSCVNEVGLKRAGFPEETIRKLHRAFKLLIKKEPHPPIPEARAELAAAGCLCPEVEELMGFVERKREGRFGRMKQR
jgi:UDP-N-acetylglucosamine acyltransferase